MNAHSLKLGRSTTSNLLDAELAQLGLQFLQLLGELILALSPELTGLDLGCRLEIERIPSAVTFSWRKREEQNFDNTINSWDSAKHTMVGGFEACRAGCRR